MGKFKKFLALKGENINIFFYKMLKKNSRVPLGKLLLFSFLLLILGWFVIKAVFALNTFYSLSQNVPCEVVSLTVREEGNNRFLLKSTLHVTYEEKIKEIQAFLPRVYPNRFAAQQALEKRDCLPDRLWMSPEEPHVVAFEKHFPWKDLSSACVIFIIELYFLVLGVYVVKKEERNI